MTAVAGSRTMFPTVSAPTAKGYRRAATDTRDITVRFDAETFEELRQRAIKHKTSVGEQVRLMVDWGFLAEENDHD